MTHAQGLDRDGASLPGHAVGVLIIGRWRCAGDWRRRAASGAAPSPCAGPARRCVWVCLQGAFGALTVTMKLYPAIVTAAPARRHGAAGAAGGAGRALRAAPPRAVARAASAASARWPLLTVAADRARRLGQHQLRGAGLQRASPPARAAGGRAMDSAHGFTLLRQLGGDGDGGYLPFAALTAIHMAHRLGAPGPAAGAAGCWPGACGAAGAAMLRPLGARPVRHRRSGRCASGLVQCRARLAAGRGGRAHRRRGGAGGRAAPWCSCVAARAAARGVARPSRAWRGVDDNPRSPPRLPLPANRLRSSRVQLPRLRPPHLAARVSLPSRCASSTC